MAVLLTLALSVAALATVALAIEPDSEAKPITDYSAYYTASDVLELSGVAIEDVERDYLNKYVGVVFEYDDVLHTATGSNIAPLMDGDVLTVFAYPYEYTTPDGIKISWIPTSATFGDREPKDFDFDGESYLLTFAPVTDEEKDIEASLAVEFRREFVIPKESISPIINRAYTDAVAWDAYVTYIAEREVYDSELLIYNKYVREKQDYDESVAEYDAYLKELSAFEAALGKYEDYLAEMEEYKAAEELYNKYLDDLKKYDSDVEAYAAYLSRIEFLNNRLSAIEATKVKMTDDREVYAAIMGNAVTEVLENKSVITSQFVGVNEDVVEVAGRATTALRELLPGYFALKTAKERYEYYTTNYESLRDNFIALARSLDCLYANAKVRGVIVKEGKDWKFVILVAQLSYIANALSDEPVMSHPVHGTGPNYKSVAIDGNHTLIYKGDKIKISKILQNKTYMVDTGDADPDDGAYPDAMTSPVLPEEVKAPVRPDRVDKPVAPEVVAAPGDPPTVVARPVAPTYAAPPIKGVDPTSPEVAALLDTYKSGALAYRLADLPSLTVTATKTVTKKVFNRDEVNVAFYGEDGELISMINVDRGEHVIFDGVLPTRPETDTATYVFDYWAHYGTGERADLLSVTDDLMLYPVFRTVMKTCPITFTVNGETVTVDVEYGTVPTPPEDPKKPEDSYYEYVFCGWDNEIVEVTGPATYTARFDAVPIVNADAPVSVEKGDTCYVVDANEASDTVINIHKVMERAAEMQLGLILRTGGAELTLSRSTVSDMISAGKHALGISVVRESYGYTYELVLGGSKRTLPTSYTVKVSIPVDGYATDGAKLSYVNTDGERLYVPCTREGDLLTFNIKTGYKYTYAVERTVDVLKSDLVELTTTHKVVHPGDTVGIALTVPEGIIVGRVYLKCSDGTEIDVSGGEFVMPDSDVLLVVNASYAEYKIVFMNGGRVIATYNCKYGDTLTPPANMTKANDGTYSYTFLGWSSDGTENICQIAPVTGDLTYTAVYEKHLLPPMDDGGFVVSEKVLRLIIAAAVALGMIVFVVIPASVIGIILTYKNRKMRRRRHK